MSSETDQTVDEILDTILRFYRASAPADLVEYAMQCPDHRRKVLELLVYEVHHLKIAVQAISRGEASAVGFIDPYDAKPKGH